MVHDRARRSPARQPSGSPARRLGPWLWAFLLGWMWLVPAMAQQLPPALFTDTQAILIPTSGTASPYPSYIGVADLPGHVAKVTVRLAGLRHTWPQDLDILLVGPQGQSVMLLSGAGGQQSPKGVDLIFDDDAPQSVPQDSEDALPSASYRPTDYSGGWETLPSPAPQGSYGAALSVFQGTDPNGTWSLYVFDDMGGNRGRIDMGWALAISVGP